MTTRAEQVAEQIAEEAGGLYPSGREMAVRMARIGYRRGLQDAVGLVHEEVEATRDEDRRIRLLNVEEKLRRAVFECEHVSVPIPFQRR